MPYSDLRIGRRSIPGQEYLVTSVTHARMPVFAVASAREALIRNLRAGEDSAALTWLAWVITPDHFHGLLRLGDRVSLSRIMQQLKGRTSRQIDGRVWQPGFHDRALRAGDDRIAAARYLLANPLRAGLCARLRDYPHGYCVWIEAGDDPDAFLMA